jgi:hypothetical protein
MQPIRTIGLLAGSRARFIMGPFLFLSFRSIINPNKLH